jgi:hypothetical protein
MFTELEKTVLVACHAFWNYGDEFEKEDNAVMFNAEDIVRQTSLPINTVKGVMGSLYKKGLFVEMEGGGLYGNVIETGITDEGIDAVLALID